ncbi:MAG TPA: NAD(+)/NADH kinase [Ktedonobacterales bacterium]|nr:NAD(+)/NADH kinase [Ktedonobacterales bacterium]
MNARVGIIANAAAAHDVRRLSGHGSIVDNHEKVRILRRILVGLQAAGIADVLAMPDHYSLAMAAASTRGLQMRVRIVDMVCANDERDSVLAAQRMVAEQCACIVVLGGDGTCRAVAKGCGDVPLLPISTGTNNVIPQHIEGTVAGLAAGLFARGLLPATLAIRRSKRLEVVRDSEVIESALVDIAVSAQPFLGARAITDLSSLCQLWLTQAVPGSLGLSAIGAHLRPLSPADEHALLLELGAPPTPDTPTSSVSVLAPIAPGLMRQAMVRSWRLLNIGEPVEVRDRPCVLALDGERALPVLADEPPISIRATWTGPRLLDVDAIMDYAAIHGLFLGSVVDTHAGDRAGE